MREAQRLWFGDRGRWRGEDRVEMLSMLRLEVSGAAGVGCPCSNGWWLSHSRSQEGLAYEKLRLVSTFWLRDWLSVGGPKDGDGFMYTVLGLCLMKHKNKKTKKLVSLRRSSDRYTPANSRSRYHRYH